MGQGVQLKATLVADPPTAGQRRPLPFRSDNFDHAWLVLCSPQDYCVKRAALLLVDVAIGLWRWSDHVHGNVLPLAEAVLNKWSRGADVTTEFILTVS